MKRLFLIIFAAAVFSVTGAQTSYVIETSGNTFTPADITITVGDTVIWKNSGGGFHNVVADDGSFSSGSASSSNWTFVWVFDSEGTFGYFCEVHGSAGGGGMSGTVTVEQPTGIDDAANDFSYALEQNYPNPFNPVTNISFTLAENGYTELKIYNVTGSEIAALISERMESGNYTIQFNAGDLPSGVYIYRITSGTFEAVRKLNLIK